MTADALQNRDRLHELITPHLPRIRELRHELHQYPETAHEETRTVALVQKVLHDLGLTTKTCTPTGLVADVGPNPTVALRADLDGLPLEERTGLPYSSRSPGKMHACGHDGHTAILLGAAMVLASRQGSLAPGGVRLLFQPAEEGADGAPRAIAAGALEGVDVIYGLHNWPAYPEDTLAVVEGPIMAASGNFFATVTGRSGHGSQPQLTRDPIVAAAHAVTHLQSIISRENDPRQPQVVSVCTIHGGDAPNIIPDDVQLSGTVRAFNDQAIDRLGERVGQTISAVAEVCGCRASYGYERHTPTLINHRAEADLVAEVGREVMGPESLSKEGLPVLGAEDFAYYLHQRRGAYFFLGGGRPGQSSPMCHSSHYDFNDNLLLPGIAMFLRLVERELNCGLA
jgi:amidohydrolase